MTIAAIESNRFEAMEQVADLTMQGHTATAIAKELNLQRKVVLELQEDYRIALSKDGEARDLARDHLNLMVKHYDSLIKKFYDLIEEINSLSFNHQVAGQKNMALKAIADLDAKRIDALQKAGLLESSELGAELADAEEKREILIHIIREAVCDDCREKISYKIAQVTGKVEVIDAEVISG